MHNTSPDEDELFRAQKQPTTSLRGNDIEAALDVASRMVSMWVQSYQYPGANEHNQNTATQHDTRS